MADVTVQSTEKAPTAESVAGKKTRLFFVDHLRAALVILVVLHHIAMVYGASAPFYYVEPPFTAPQAFKALLVFVLVNQAWFMGAFFLLAGYFTPGSYDRKGPASFLQDRLLRLGVPLILFIFILSAISNLGLFLMPASLTGITEPLTWQLFWEKYADLIGIGPLWFVAMLLVFSIGYAIWRLLVKNRSSSKESDYSAPSYLGIGFFILALALVSYLWRFIVPLGESVSILDEVVSFPTIAYLPQYISFFVIGAIAYRHNWFRSIPGSMGIVGLIAAVLAFVLLFPLAFSGQMFSFELSEALDNAMGNGEWQSAAYTLWDSIFAVGIILAAITFFRRFIGRESRIGTFLSQQSYAVYIIHIPLIVFIAYALKGVKVGTLTKFGLASLVIVPVCFVAAYIIRKIPGVSRIL